MDPNFHKPIIYVKGDATCPIDLPILRIGTRKELKIIAHVCNDAGLWNKGFVTALSDKWPAAKLTYLKMPCRQALGNISFEVVEYKNKLMLVSEAKSSGEQPSYAKSTKWEIDFESKIGVCNMVGQRGLTAEVQKGQIIREDGSLVEITNTIPPIRYAALHMALFKLYGLICILNGDYDLITVHMPRIGCGLAGGSWSKVEPLIKEELSDRGIQVVVYDLP